MAQTYNVQIEDSAGNKYCPKPDLLTTKEQLTANNTSGKSVDALVVKAMNNDFNAKLPSGVKLIVEGSGADTKYYAQLGADAASKKLLGNGNGDVYIRVKTSGAYPTQGLVVAISFDNETWKNVISLSLDCHAGGNAFSTSKSVKYTVTD